MKYIFFTYLLVFVICFKSNGQTITLSNIKVFKQASIDESSSNSLIISLNISDIESSPSLKISVNESNECSSYYLEYFHIKKYPDATYIKHNGQMTKVDNNHNFKFEIQLDEYIWNSVKSICIEAIEANTRVSNLVNKTIDNN